MRSALCVSALAMACAPVATLAAELLNENFTLNPSANWTVNQTADNNVNFAFDYSTMGIPSAPRSGDSSTIGLRMASNLSSGSQQGVTLSPNGVQITNGTTGVLMTFDMWINANGPFPGGGTGSTEMLTAGIGYNGSSINRPNGLSGSGAWFAVTGEGGAARDFRAHKNSVELTAYVPGSNPLEPSDLTVYAASTDPGNQPGLDQDNASVYYAQFVGQQAPALQQANYPQQTDALANGTVGFAWRKVDIIARGNTAQWYIDGLLIATLDRTVGDSFNITGGVSLGYADPFNSVSNAPDLSFGLVDNVAVYALGAKGDVNDDGNVNNLDIAAFVNLLTGGGSVRPDILFAGDVNGDGVVNNLDIAPFVALLTGGRPVGDDDPEFGPLLALVPEPASLSLLALGGLMLGRRRRA